MRFANRAAELAANIVAAQCKDLGMELVSRNEDGTVWAQIGDVDLLLKWNVEKQAVQCLGRLKVGQVPKVA